MERLTQLLFISVFFCFCLTLHGISEGSLMQVIHYVTGNKSKFEEAESYFKKYAPDIQLVGGDLEIVEPQTLDQRAIALHKAKEAWKILRKPLLVDDEGIYFHAYNNFPGVFTKFVYQGIGLKGLFKLLDEDNRMLSKLFLVYVDDMGDCQVFEGGCEGVIVTLLPGVMFNPSCPYDSVFIPQGEDKVYGQLSEAEQSKYSSRLRALKQFLAWYQEKCGKECF